MSNVVRLSVVAAAPLQDVGAVTFIVPTDSIERANTALQQLEATAMLGQRILAKVDQYGDVVLCLQKMSEVLKISAQLISG